LEALRFPLGLLVAGGPAIALDPTCETLIPALAGKVAYREAFSGLERVTTDQKLSAISLSMPSAPQTAGSGSATGRSRP